MTSGISQLAKRGMRELDSDDRILGVNYAHDPPAYLLYTSPSPSDELEFHCWYCILETNPGGLRKGFL